MVRLSGNSYRNFHKICVFRIKVENTLDPPIKSGDDILKCLFPRHSRGGGNPDFLLLRCSSTFLRMNLKYWLTVDGVNIKLLITQWISGKNIPEGGGHV